MITPELSELLQHEGPQPHSHSLSPIAARRHARASLEIGTNRTFTFFKKSTTFLRPAAACRVSRQGSLLNVDSMAAVIIHKKIQAGGRLGGAAKGAPRRLSLAARVFGGKPPSDGEKKEKYPAYVTLWLVSIHSYTSRLSTASRTHTHHTGALSSRTLSLVRTSQVPAEGAEREDAE